MSPTVERQGEFVSGAALEANEAKVAQIVDHTIAAYKLAYDLLDAAERGVQIVDPATSKVRRQRILKLIEYFTALRSQFEVVRLQKHG